MRLSRESWLAATFAIVVGLATTLPTSSFAQSDIGVLQPTASTGLQLSYSPGIHDVLKMLDAKVDMEVIKAYIKNSPIPFNPSATEIIALKNHGVPDDLITAMIQHGAEVRAQLAQSAQMAAPPTSPTTAAPGYSYGGTTPYPDYSSSYPYDYSSYGYGYPNYPYYGYPYYYGYGYPYYPYYSWWFSTYYPFGCFWPYYCGVHSHGHFSHFHNDHFHGDHFHGTPHTGFANHAGSVNHAGAWAPTGHSFAQGSAMPARSFSMAGRAPSMASRSFAFSGSRMGGFGGHASVGHFGGFGGGHGGFSGGHGGGGGGHGGGHR
jgi:hypothetical protein